MASQLPKLIASDIDGTLTDGCRYLSDSGEEMKRFFIPDGVAFLALQKSGISTALITADRRPLIEIRSQQLKVDWLLQGVKNKVEAIESLCRQMNISWQDVGFIGDDINDLEVLKRVGFAACPSDAQALIQNIPGIYKSPKEGGQGAFRNWIENLFGLEFTLRGL